MTKLLPLALWIVFSLPAVGEVYQSSVIVGPNILGLIDGIYATTQPALEGHGAALGLKVTVPPHGRLQPPRAVLSPSGGTVGIGHVWYEVAGGTVIDPAYTATATPFYNADNPSISGLIQLTPNPTFLLGFWLDANFDQIPDTGDRFGWARLSYTAASGLTLLDNAIEDTTAGIIAGTTTTAPEPGGTALLLAGGVLLALRRRRGAAGV